MLKKIEDINLFPATSGIVKMYDEKGKLIRVSASRNIAERVKQLDGYMAEVRATGKSNGPVEELNSIYIDKAGKFTYGYEVTESVKTADMLKDAWDKSGETLESQVRIKRD